LEYKECNIAVIFGDVKNIFDNKKVKKRMRLKAEIKGRYIHKGLIVINTPVLMRLFDKKENFRRIGMDSFSADLGNFNNKNCNDRRWKLLSNRYNIKLNFSRKRDDNILFIFFYKNFMMLA